MISLKQVGFGFSIPHPQGENLPEGSRSVEKAQRAHLVSGIMWHLCRIPLWNSVLAHIELRGNCPSITNPAFPGNFTVRLAAILIAIWATSAATGCAVTRKSVSIDSGSKTPWLGLELAPKKKSAVPEATRIRRDDSVPLEPVPANLVKDSAPQPKEDSWWQKLTGTEKRTPIKLPRTDLEDAAANKPSAVTPAESASLEF
jgi:hypothetical protein